MKKMEYKFFYFAILCMLIKCIANGQIINPNSIDYDSISVDTMNIDSELIFGKSYYKKNKMVLRQTFFSNGNISAQSQFGKKELNLLWDSTGILIYRGESKNGIRNGDETSWYSDKSIKSIGHFYNGKGQVKTYYPTGELKGVANYDDKLLNVDEYCQNGNLLFKIDYTKENYIWKEYYCNGQLKLTGTLIKGKRSGKWHYYSESNELIKEEVYELDMLISSMEY